ncbi:MAG: YDG domain-containing protein, partial [Bifidobacteriaceae bacterium]|nr:YDG domain-containing protein [Bifidobacteriaceae bacterium]
MSREVSVLVRVVDGAADALPVTGGGFGWGLGLAALVLVAAGVALVLAGRRGRAGRVLLLGAGAVLALAAVGGPAAAGAAGGSVVVTVDKRDGLTGSARAAVDVSALGSGLLSVDGSASGDPRLGLSFDGVGLGAAPARVADVADKDFSGVLEGSLRVAVAADIPVGEYRAAVVFRVVDRRTALSQVAAGFETKVYDGGTAVAASGTPSLVGVAAGDAVSAGGLAFSLASKDAGSAVPVVVTGGTLGGPDAWKYRLAGGGLAVVAPGGGSAVVVVEARPVSVDVGVSGKVYDGTTSAVLGSASAAGLVVGDDVVLGGSPTASFATKDAGPGKAVTVTGYALVGADAANYTLVQPSGLTADVAKRPVSPSGGNLQAASRQYDGTLVAPLTGQAALAPGDYLAGDDLSLVGTAAAGAFADKNVGAGKPVTVTGYTLAGADAANYVLAQPADLAADVTPRPVTPTGGNLQAVSRAYDGTLVAPLTGQAALDASDVMDDDELTLSGTPTGSFADQNAGAGKLVTVTGYTLTGDDAANYALVQPSGLTAAIAPKSLTFTGTVHVDRMIGDADPARFDASVTNPGSFSGLVGSDAFSLDTAGVTGVAVADHTTEADTTGAATGAFALAPDSPGSLASNYSLAPISVPVSVVQPIVLGVTTNAPGQQVTLNKYFPHDYTIDWGDVSGAAEPAPDTSTTHTYAAAGSYEITLTSTRTHQTRRWWFELSDAGLVPAAGTNATVVVAAMPRMRAFTPSATASGFDLFYRFNYEGALTGLPDGSFDTSGIEDAGSYFFSDFNYKGALTELPEGSFDTSGVTAADPWFFADFNREGALTSLPEGSFNIGGLTAADSWFFADFNYGGALTGLPAGSFNTANIESAGDDFFRSFNYGGALTGLPAGSFNTTNIESAGAYYFAHFNYSGSLTTLPTGSFDTGGMESAGDYFFAYFNYSGSLNALPAGSFNTSAIASAGDSFFERFNAGGELTGLPDDSFDISGITAAEDRFFAYFNSFGDLAGLSAGSFNTANIESAGDYFFTSFNYEGALAELPEGSFNTAGIESAGDSFFTGFNRIGALTELPAGSFNSGGIESAGDSFFAHFNWGGALTELPAGSFNTTGIEAAGDSFFAYFNASGALTGLPDGSFNTTGIEAAGDSFFAYFNYFGALTGLPEGSFNTVGIEAAGDFFFAYFNDYGALTGLPDGSFN